MNKKVYSAVNKINNLGLLVAFALGIIASIAVFTLSFYFIEKQTENQCVQRLADENRMSAVRFDTLLKTDVNRLNIAASIFSEYESLKSSVSEKLLNNIRKTSGFKDVFVMFSNGDIIGGSSLNGSYLSVFPKVFGNKSVGITYVGNDAGVYDIVVYVPIFEGKSALVGIIDKMNYASVYDTNGMYYSDKIIVIDEDDGTIIMTFNSDGEYESDYIGNIYQNGERFGVLDNESAIKLERDMQSNTGGAYQLRADEEKVYISYYPIVSDNWMILMNMSDEQIVSIASDGKREFSLILMGLLCMYMIIVIASLVFQRKRVKENEAILMQYKVAELASEAKTRFMSNMSHDIRTPLNAIVGLADICEMNADNPERVKDCITKQKAASEHLMTLINDVLDMSRIESGKDIFGRDEFSIGEQIHGIVVMLRNDMREKKLSCKVSAGNMFHERVVGDVQRINRVLLNILSNSVKYTNSGGKISISVNEKRSEKEGYSEFEYTVADNGIGMTEEFVKKIFVPFERMEDSTVSRIDGAGLGMTIANELITKMGGTIDVQSVLGQGTTITVTIPLEVIDNSEDRAILKEFSDRYIVVVDDDSNLVEWVRRLVLQMDMRCIAKTDGYEALTSIKDITDAGGQIALIILGWQMPRIDGVELAKEIRRLIGNEVIIAMQTSREVDMPEKDIKAAGINTILVEPVFESDILGIFREVVNGKTENGLSIPDFSGRRVLLVEDHLVNAEIMEEYLRYTGIEVEVVNDGTEAVGKMSSCPDGYYDVILMDIRMPKMDGYMATKRIRGMNREYARRVPIIALSANAFADDIKKSREVGMNGHLAKPVKYDEIYRELNKWFM